ncbi:MAG: adenosylmethionine--8-amino-7-oxononanoate transaminase [Bacteroidota bacterium]
MNTTTTNASLLDRDKRSIWHPFTPLLGSRAVLPVQRAEGVYLYTEDGRQILDCIASWWVNLHGHSHPHIAEAIYRQAMQLEHVIFAGFTHEPAVQLAEKLLEILPINQSKVFYSDNGSTAVEVGLKMAFQYWYNQGIQKKKVIAISGSYHGDTFGAMSVGDRSPFNAPFAPFLFDVTFIDFPACHREACCLGNAVLKRGCSEGSRDATIAIIRQFQTLAESGEVAAFIFEPLVQGSSGMRMYAAHLLDELMRIAKANHILCIADEVMTGFGRTGELFASDHLSQAPDIMCLSKGLTGGTMALGATTCTEEVIAAFRSDDLMRTFFHGHSFTANPLACAAALASLDLLLTEECSQHIYRIAQKHLDFTEQMQNHPGIKEIRCLGVILAVEIHTLQATGYFNEARNSLNDYFLEQDLLIRPLGNVIYVLPPYVITNEELDRIYAAITQLLQIGIK